MMQPKMIIVDIIVLWLNYNSWKITRVLKDYKDVFTDNRNKELLFNNLNYNLLPRFFEEQ